MSYIIESATETAKKVRQALKEAFPDLPVKHFSVKSKSYSGGSSLSVTWEDYPHTEEVKKITSHFEGASFDGMQDLKTTRAYEWKGNMYSGADFIFTSRTISSARQAMAENIAKLVYQDYDMSRNWENSRNVFNNIEQYLTPDLSELKGSNFDDTFKRIKEEYDISMLELRFAGFELKNKSEEKINLDKIISEILNSIVEKNRDTFDADINILSKYAEYIKLNIANNYENYKANLSDTELDFVKSSIESKAIRVFLNEEVLYPAHKLLPNEIYMLRKILGEDYENFITAESRNIDYMERDVNNPQKFYDYLSELAKKFIYNRNENSIVINNTLKLKFANILYDKFKNRIAFDDDLRKEEPKSIIAKFNNNLDNYLNFTINGKVSEVEKSIVNELLTNPKIKEEVNDKNYTGSVPFSTFGAFNVTRKSVYNTLIKYLMVNDYDVSVTFNQFFETPEFLKYYNATLNVYAIDENYGVVDWSEQLIEVYLDNMINDLLRLDFIELVNSSNEYVSEEIITKVINKVSSHISTNGLSADSEGVETYIRETLNNNEHLRNEILEMSNDFTDENLQLVSKFFIKKLTASKIIKQQDFNETELKSRLNKSRKTLVLNTMDYIYSLHDLSSVLPEGQLKKELYAITEAYIPEMINYIQNRQLSNNMEKLQNRLFYTAKSKQLFELENLQASNNERIVNFLRNNRLTTPDEDLKYIQTVLNKNLQNILSKVTMYNIEYALNVDKQSSSVVIKFKTDKNKNINVYINNYIFAMDTGNVLKNYKMALTLDHVDIGEGIPSKIRVAMNLLYGIFSTTIYHPNMKVKSKPLDEANGERLTRLKIMLENSKLGAISSNKSNRNSLIWKYNKEIFEVSPYYLYNTKTKEFLYIMEDTVSFSQAVENLKENSKLFEKTSLNSDDFEKILRLFSFALNRKITNAQINKVKL